MKNAALVVLLAVAAALVCATLFPFIETKWWLIRLLDFPRVLFGIGIVVVLLLLGPFARRSLAATFVVGGAIMAALLTNAAVLWPYRPNGSADVSACPAERSLSVMIANVQLGNRDVAPLLQAVADQKPDLFLAMEIDDWWKDALRPVETDMPFTAGTITGSYYGIRFFSRLPLITPTIRAFAGRDTPSVVTGVTLRNGETVSFIGMHPKPPLPGQSSLGRDAELYAAGQVLREWSGPALLAGDLNAVPWEEAVTRMRRIAGLEDPRRGHGYVASWNTKLWWARWPLDNIFVRGGFDVLSLERLAAFGSDHFPYVVRLCRRAYASAPPADPESASDNRAIDAAFSEAGVRPERPAR